MRLILASGSPRRKDILRSAGFSFDIVHIDADESFPAGMPPEDVPLYLAGKKMDEAKLSVGSEDVVITADTIVLLRDTIINKPVDRADAVSILQSLSGNMHTVITGVCIRTPEKTYTVVEHTKVFFHPLHMHEINMYLDTCKPYDKAGAYAIQEWIGVNKIAKIEGDYYNVVGFPMQRVFPILKSLGF